MKHLPTLDDIAAKARAYADGGRSASGLRAMLLIVAENVHDAANAIRRDRSVTGGNCARHGAYDGVECYWCLHRALDNWRTAAFVTLAGCVALLAGILMLLHRL